MTLLHIIKKKKKSARPTLFENFMLLQYNIFFFCLIQLTSMLDILIQSISGLINDLLLDLDEPLENLKNTTMEVQGLISAPPSKNAVCAFQISSKLLSFTSEDS